MNIPSFVFGNMPTNAALDACRNAGLIQASVTTYAGPQDYLDKQSSNPLPTSDGAAKWWSDPNTPAVGYFAFTGRVKKASERTTIENMAYSQWAQAFYTERPNLIIPEFEAVLGVAPSEWRRLSFADSIGDPPEYPLGLIWKWDPYGPSHAFPGNVILYMNNDVPAFEMISTALTMDRFKLQPQMPTGPGAGNTGGYTAAQYVAGVKKALSINSKAAVLAAVNLGGGDSAIAERLVKL